MVNKDNFLIFAMKAYHNPICKTLIEFEEDLGKFSNLSRICSKDMDETETLVLLNAVVTLFNLFDHSACIEMMRFKVKKADREKLDTILLYLNRITTNEMGNITCLGMIDILRNV